MLRPRDLANAAEVDIATKPGVGYETKVSVSSKRTLELGQLEIGGLNSGTYTANATDTSALATDQRKLVAMLIDGYNGSANIVVTVTGTDQVGGALSGTATIQPPTYSRNQDKVFPPGAAAEVVVVDDTRYFKTVTAVTVTCAADAAATKLSLFGMPDIASFHQVPAKMSVTLPLPGKMPLNIREGSNPQRWTKPGEQAELTGSISAKDLTSVDGLRRYNGLTVTAVVEHVKEDKVVVLRAFLVECVFSSKLESTDEAQGTDTVTSEYRCQDVAMIPVQQGF